MSTPPMKTPGDPLIPDRAGRQPARRLTRARQLAVIGAIVALLAAAMLLRYQLRIAEDRRAGVSGATIEYRVDVNAADETELQLLPGIGPTLAGAIIEHRRSRGPFRSTDDLMRVRGIGVTIARGMEPYVSFGEAVR